MTDDGKDVLREWVRIFEEMLEMLPVWEISDEEIHRWLDGRIEE